MNGISSIVWHSCFEILFQYSSLQQNRKLCFFLQMTISTDMDNVTCAVPAIHPMYKIGDGQAVNHTRPFTAVAGGF